MSDWVPEAQRIAKEAAEKAAMMVRADAVVAYSWLIEGCPTPARAVLWSILWLKPMPSEEEQRRLAAQDRATADAKANEVALNARLAEARDAALEEAVQAINALWLAEDRSAYIDAREAVDALKGRK